MAFCSKCGNQLNNSERFCPKCGTPVENVARPVQPRDGAYGNPQMRNPQPRQPGMYPRNPQPQRGPRPMPTQTRPREIPYNSEYDPQDIASNKVMAVLSYLGLLVLIPLFAAPNSKYARFHVKQGINLLILNIIYSIISILFSLIKTPTTYWGVVEVWTTPWFIYVIIFLLGIPIIVLCIIGIVNAVKGQTKELPVIGKFKIMK